VAADDPVGGEDRQIPHLLPPMRREYFELAIPLREYFEALRAGDAQLRAADEKFHAERDRRYAEVNVEKEKALKIKETADLAALQLAREIQTYKDEKANELREQISSERGRYVTREELASSVRELQAAIKPLTEYTTSDAGRNAGAAGYRTDQRLNTSQVIAALGFLAAVVTLILYVTKK
jgi:hypothetical protein